MKGIPTSRVVVGDRIRTELPRVAELAASIEARGQLQPIVVRSQDNVLLAGARRLAACQQLGIDVLVRFVGTAQDSLEALRCEGAEQLERVDWTPQERARYAQQLLVLEREAAAERRREGGRKGGRKGGQAEADESCGAAVPKLPAEERRAATLAAKAAGFASRKDFERTLAVVEAVESNPELQPILDKLNETGKASAAVAAVKRARAVGGLHDKDSYSTPGWWMAGVHACEAHGIDLDCCSNALARELGNVDARVSWTIDDDALAQPTWDVNGDGTTVLFFQPPYSRPDTLAERLAKEWDAGHLRRVHCLVKDDPSTDWWAWLRDRAAYLIVPRERLHHVIGTNDDGSEVVEPNSNFCSAGMVLAREGDDLAGLYRALRAAYDGRADVYPAGWVVDLWMKGAER